MYPIGRLSPNLDVRSIEGWQPTVSKIQLCVCGEMAEPSVAARPLPATTVTMSVDRETV
jgi:hypothetical protein